LEDGSTDSHKHNFPGLGPDFMDLSDTSLESIADYLDDDDTPFKIIVSNADLSPGGRLVLNTTYDSEDPSSWVNVDLYDDVSPSELTVFSLSGADGTVRLDSFGVYFHSLVFGMREVHPSRTGCVRDNVLGAAGEWRNGALTIQAVEVDAALSTDLSLSAGGVQGVATEGLIWESTIFWHWDGPCYGESGWSSYVP
jgi:hypothetical protein